MFRARLRARLCRGKEGLHRAPTLVRQVGGYTHHLLLFLSSTHYCPRFHPLLSEISSSSCKDLARGSARSKTPGVVWSTAGRRPTRSAAAAARILRPGPQDPNARRRNHLRTVRGGAQTHTRSAAAAARILRPSPQDPNARRRNHLRISMMSRAETKSVFYHPPHMTEKGMGIPTFVHSPKSNKNPLF